VNKDREEFYKRKINKDGLYSWCKECSKAKTKAHALANPEKVKASREKRKDRALAVAREYKRKNKDRLSKLQKVHYYLNREKLCQKAREWSKNLSPEKKKIKRQYYLKWSKTENAKKYNTSRKAVYNALKKGILIKPNKCTLCFREEKLEGHHPDYNKPLEVVWLCKKCHGIVHRN
jgi:hypothetical protein